MRWLKGALWCAALVQIVGCANETKQFPIAGRHEGVVFSSRPTIRLGERSMGIMLTNKLLGKPVRVYCHDQTESLHTDMRVELYVEDARNAEVFGGSSDYVVVLGRNVDYRVTELKDK